MKLRTSARAARRAAAAVELAFLLQTVLFPVIMAVWELGRLVEVQQVLDNAVREGARQASTGQKTNSQVIAAVQQYITDCGMGSANPTVTVTNLTSGLDVSQANQLDHIQITVSVQYNNIRMTTLSDFLSSSTTLQASVDWSSMRDLPLNVSATIPSMPQ